MSEIATRKSALKIRIPQKLEWLTSLCFGKVIKGDRLEICSYIWASTRENLSSGVCEQHRCRPACADHPRSLISAFVICFRESTIFDLATDEISLFQLVSVAEETGLKLGLTETPKT